MARLTPDQAGKKWASRLSGATSDIQTGVNAVTIAPSSQAAAKADKWQQKVSSPDAKSRFVTGLNGVTLSDWQTAMINKGLPRVASGAQAATGKMTTFMTQLLPFQDTLSSKIKAMPDLTLQDSIARMTAFVTGMASFKKS